MTSTCREDNGDQVYIGLSDFDRLFLDLALLQCSLVAFKVALLSRVGVETDVSAITATSEDICR